MLNYIKGKIQGSFNELRPSDGQIDVNQFSNHPFSGIQDSFNELRPADQQINMIANNSNFSADPGLGGVAGGGARGGPSEVVAQQPRDPNRSTLPTLSANIPQDQGAVQPQATGAPGAPGAVGGGQVAPPRAPGVGGTSMSDLEQYMGGARDAHMSGQEASLRHAMESEINALKSAYADAIANGEISVRQAEADFQANAQEITKRAYENDMSMRLRGSQMGLTNSNQIAGMAKSNYTSEMGMINQNMSEKDRRVADVRDRLSALKTQKQLAVAGAESNFNYGMANAQSQADMMYNQNMFDVKKQDWSSAKSFAQDLEKMAIQNGYAQALQSAGFQNQLKIMSIEMENKAKLLTEQKESEMASQLAMYFDKNSPEYKIRLAQAQDGIREFVQQQIYGSAAADWMASLDQYKNTEDNKFFMSKHYNSVDEFNKQNTNLTNLIGADFNEEMNLGVPNSREAAIARELDKRK